MYNCPTFFLFWKCLDDMSYWTNLYLTVADDELHFFTFSNLNYIVFVSLAHMTSVQPGGMQHTHLPSHHPCSELRIPEHSGKTFYSYNGRDSHSPSFMLRVNRSR